MTQPERTVMQMAYVVEDLETAMSQWLERVKVGPFFVLRHLQAENTKYRGTPTQIHLDIALGFSGDVCIELIQQQDQTPSVYREMLERTGPGFHHWGLFSENFDEDVARYQKLGHAEAFTGKVSIGARFAYMDTVASLGGMIELIELTPQVRDLFYAMESAHWEWDGSEPIRYLE